MSKIVVVAWTPPATRDDGSSIQPSDIASYIISQKNADGSLTAVATAPSDAVNASFPAPTVAGDYPYVVEAVDASGEVGDPGLNIKDITIAAAPISAPTGVTSTLQDAPATPGSGTSAAG